MGFAIIAQGIDGVIWEEIGFIVLSWVTSPLVAGTLAFSMFFLVRLFILRADNSFERGLYFMPLCYWFTLAINVFFVVFKGSGGGFIDLSVIPLWGVAVLSLGSGYLAGFLIFMLLPVIRRKAIVKYELQCLVQVESKDGKKAPVSNPDNDDSDDDRDPMEDGDGIVELEPRYQIEAFDPRTEQLFSFLQVLTACFGSFAHGANDVANAIGPFAVVISVYDTNSVEQDSPIPWWILAGGGLGIVIGLATWGHKVMKTIGENLAKVCKNNIYSICIVEN